MIDPLRALLAEVDCRIEHGAQSGGHLEYVRERLRELVDYGDGPHDHPPGEPCWADCPAQR